MANQSAKRIQSQNLQLARNLYISGLFSICTSVLLHAIFHGLLGSIWGWLSTWVYMSGLIAGANILLARQNGIDFFDYFISPKSHAFPSTPMAKSGSLSEFLVDSSYLLSVYLLISPLISVSSESKVRYLWKWSLVLLEIILLIYILWTTISAVIGMFRGMVPSAEQAPNRRQRRSK